MFKISTSFSVTLMIVGFASLTHAAESLYFGAQSLDLTQNEFCFLHATIPTVVPSSAPGAAAASAKINQHYQSVLENLKRDYAANIVGKCKDAESANRIRLSFTIHSALDSDVVSLILTETDETGGEHPNHILKPETFDAQTGEMLPSLASFLKPGTIDKFKEVIESQLAMTVPNFDPEAGWKTLTAEWTDLDKVTNFYFAPDGMVLVFNDYEIAPFGQGAIKVSLDWGDLRDLGLQTSGPATRLKLYP